MAHARRIDLNTMGAVKTVAEAPPHAADVAAAVLRFESDRAAGLTSAEVAERLARYGPNTLPEAAGRSLVAAIVQPREGATPTLDQIQEQCRKKIAGYKLPRQLHLVDEIERSPSGKPDYRWAKAIATGG